MTRIRLATEIEAPPEVCFDTCLNVDVQLALDHGMRAVAGVHTGRLLLGDTVTWQARHFGIIWHMTSKIVEVDRPHFFADQMQRGPFADWRHVHTFEKIEIGTRMLDEVEYHPPLGYAGRLFDTVVLARYLTRLLAVRNRRLKLVAEQTAEAGSNL